MISIKWSETAPKYALASADIIVTQLLCYHMPLLYFVCSHLIYHCDDSIMSANASCFSYDIAYARQQIVCSSKVFSAPSL